MKRLPLVDKKGAPPSPYAPPIFRSIAERDGDPSVLEAKTREFHEDRPFEPPPGVDRRTFLGLMGASLALGGLAGCHRPEEKIVPFSKQPEDLIPGRPEYYATSMPFYGTAIGIVVESNDGRPTKIEGNPRHPDSWGGTTAFVQAHILNLYDPDRSDGPQKSGKDATSEEAWSFLGDLGEKLRASNGEGLGILITDHRSETTRNALNTLVQQLKKPGDDKWPWPKIVKHEAFGREFIKVGAEIAFGDGNQLDAVLDVEKADVIVALDSDFLGSEGSPIKASKKFSRRRRVDNPAMPMNRLYVAEPCPTVTSALADHRIRIQSRKIVSLLKGLVAELAKVGVAVPAELGDGADLSPKEKEFVAAAANDLAGARKGAGLVVIGRRQDPAVHALGILINDALGSVAIGYKKPFGGNAENFQLGQLVEEMKSGKVKTLLILGGNPVFTAPSDLALADLLPKVPTTIHLSSHVDETSKLCTWHIPRAHELESWSDTRAEDGTASIIQPIIQPMYEGKTDAEVLHRLGGGVMNAYDLVRAAYAQFFSTEPAPAKIYGQAEGMPQPAAPDAVPPARDAVPPARDAVPPARDAVPAAPPAPAAPGISSDFDKAWRKAIFDGFVQQPGTIFPNEVLPVDKLRVAQALKAQTPVAGATEIVFTADPHAYDGRFANNGWMQETPDPIHKLTWTNAAALSAGTAKKLGVEDGDMLKVAVGDTSISIPAIVTYGHADDSITVYVGQGRVFASEVPNSYGLSAGEREPIGVVGVDVRPIRKGATWNIAGGSVTKGEGQAKLASTQSHFMMEGRPVVRQQTIDEYKADPTYAEEMVIPLHEKDEIQNTYGEPGLDSDARIRSLFEYKGHRWAMSIDLSLCHGCSACHTACVAENNIVVVGPAGIAHHREMHWIRIDRYFAGIEVPEANEDDARAVSMPMLCQHCENAPCEQVCPVAATTHSPEGLNEMTYNRCIGTKYCGNNCPFKVRRFNFFNYTKEIPETLKLQLNPDVTVRSRGVMEKCSFCVQRIQEAKIAAKKLRKADGTEGTPEEQRKRENEFMRAELVSACQQACPTEAITFGDLNDERAQIASVLKFDAQRATPNNGRAYKMLEEINVRPRVHYLGRVSNPNTKLEPPKPTKKKEHAPEHAPAGHPGSAPHGEEKR